MTRKRKTESRKKRKLKELNKLGITRELAKEKPLNRETMARSQGGSYNPGPNFQGQDNF